MSFSVASDSSEEMLLCSLSSYQSVDRSELQRHLEYFDTLPNPLHEIQRFRNNPQALGQVVSVILNCASVEFILNQSFDEQMENKMDAARLAAFLYNAKLFTPEDTDAFIRALVMHEDTVYPNLLAAALFVQDSLQFFTAQTLNALAQLLTQALLAQKVHGAHDMALSLLTDLEAKVQAEMVENQAPVLQRTVRVSGIDSRASEKELLDLLRACGHVVKVRLCGQRKETTLFGFFQFKTVHGAQELIRRGHGYKLGGRPLKVELATSSIKDSRQAGVHRMKCTGSIAQTGLPMSSR